jgi:hypothetical protein
MLCIEPEWPPQRRKMSIPVRNWNPSSVYPIAYSLHQLSYLNFMKDCDWLLPSSWLVYHSHAAISTYTGSVAENCHYILLFRFFLELLFYEFDCKEMWMLQVELLYSLCFNFVIRILCFISEGTVHCFSLPRPETLGSLKVIFFYHIMSSHSS